MRNSLGSLRMVESMGKDSIMHRMGRLSQLSGMGRD